MLKRFAHAAIVIVVLGVLAVFAFTAAHHWEGHQPHSVTLTWQATPQPAGVKIRGYDIYRETEPDGNYNKIASQVACCRYVDRKVESNHTYIYVVRTVDSSGRESPNSIEISAKVP